VFERQINRAILLITRSMSVSVAGAMWSAERAVIIALFFLRCETNNRLVFSKTGGSADDDFFVCFISVVLTFAEQK
jgi:hypothetical protein